MITAGSVAAGPPNRSDLSSSPAGRDDGYARAVAPLTPPPGGTVPFVTLARRSGIYYEFTGPEDRPTILQFGGSLFGRHNFGLVNDGFREHFRLLSFDASRLRALRPAADRLQRRGLGRRGARCCSTPSGSTACWCTARRWAGWSRSAFTCKYPDARDRGLRRLRLGAAATSTAGALPLLAALRRVA